ncbi:UNVERIFIED_CONTAM: hypothetical protein Slati_2248900 [Sesamum latifolium]|uniref:Uncharacterized protein n=1 Tax=Sesamum latifolium TaxID=2727402 RepID=A0AAW2WXM0_9LAMI
MCLRDLYTVPDRHIHYAAAKEFFGIKMAKGSSVHDHCVQMLSFMEKLEDLKAGIKNDIYIDVFLQSLPPSYDPFIVNFNMNELEKSIPKLINMLVQFETTIKRLEHAVMFGVASTSTKGKKARRWKKKKSKAKDPLPASKLDFKAPAVRKGIRKEVPKASKAEDACHYYYEKGHWKRNCPKSLPLAKVMARSRRLSKGDVDLRLGNGKRVVAEAMGLVHLVVRDHD